MYLIILAFLPLALALPEHPQERQDSEFCLDPLLPIFCFDGSATEFAPAGPVCGSSAVDCQAYAKQYVIAMRQATGPSELCTDPVKAFFCYLGRGKPVCGRDAADCKRKWPNWQPVC